MWITSQLIRRKDRGIHNYCSTNCGQRLTSYTIHSNECHHTNWAIHASQMECFFRSSADPHKPCFSCWDDQNASKNSFRFGLGKREDDQLSFQMLFSASIFPLQTTHADDITWSPAAKRNHVCVSSLLAAVGCRSTCRFRVMFVTAFSLVLTRTMF